MPLWAPADTGGVGRVRRARLGDRIVRTLRGEYRRQTSGFTMVELMIVVAIIAILVLVAMPVFFATMANSQQKTCFANQRTIEGSLAVWEGANPALNTDAAAQGLVSASNPLITTGQLLRPPRCPSAPAAADMNNPTAAEGAYSLDASGNVLPCPFGALGPHGSYHP